MPKPFKGVISEWYRDGDVICGRCEYHPDMQERMTADAILHNAIVRGCGMHTSRIERLDHRGEFVLCETKNSYYVLVQPREFAKPPVG